MISAATRRRPRHRRDPRHVVLLAGIGVAVLAALLTVPAIADSGDGAGPLQPLNRADSAGIRVMQYELSVPGGNIATAHQQVVFSTVLTFAWDAYRWWIALLAYLVDWTLGMEWITWLAGPINTAADHIHKGVLEPLGATGLGQGGIIALFLTVAAAVGALHIYRGRTSGWFEICVSIIVAGLGVSVLAAPVVLFAGNDVEAAKPLRYAQRMGIELGNVATTGKVSTAPLDGGGEAVTSEDVPNAEAGESAKVEPPKPGRFLLDTFIRPVHQSLNYGTVLDVEDKGCAGVYDEALKAGPYGADAEPARAAMGECNPKYQKYAETTSSWYIVVLNIFSIAALLVGVVVLVFTLLLWLAILGLLWASFRMVFTVLLAIWPGASRGPLIRDIINVAVSLLYVVTGIPLFVLLISAVKAILKSNASIPLLGRFLLIDIVLIAAIVLMIVNYWQHRKGAKSLAQRLTDKVRQGRAQLDPGGRMGRWLARPAGSSGSASWAAGGAANPGGAAPSMMRRVTGSNGGRLLTAGAQMGGTAAVAAATGGAGLAAKGVVATRRITRNASRVGTAIHAVRGGSRGATTGSERLDRTLQGWGRKGRAHETDAEQLDAGENTPTGDGAGAAQTGGYSFSAPDDSPTEPTAGNHTGVPSPESRPSPAGGPSAEKGPDGENGLSRGAGSTGDGETNGPRAGANHSAPEPDSPEGRRRHHQRLRVKLELAQSAKTAALDQVKAARAESHQTAQDLTHAMATAAQIHRDYYKGRGGKRAYEAANAKCAEAQARARKARQKVRDVEEQLKERQAAEEAAVTAEMMFRSKVVGL